jgi:putative transposase
MRWGIRQGIGARWLALEASALERELVAILAVVLTGGAALASRASTFLETFAVHAACRASKEWIRSLQHPLQSCPKRRVSLTSTLAVHRGHSPARMHPARVLRLSNPSSSASGALPHRSSNALDPRPSRAHVAATRTCRVAWAKAVTRLTSEGAACGGGCRRHRRVSSGGLAAKPTMFLVASFVSEGEELFGARLSNRSVNGEARERPPSASCRSLESPSGTRGTAQPPLPPAPRPHTNPSRFAGGMELALRSPSIGCGVAYRVKYVRHGAAKHRVMTGVELLARLSALIPPPRYPLVRFHGVLAPRSSWRRHVVPRPTATAPRRERARRRRKSIAAMRQRPRRSVQHMRLRATPVPRQAPPARRRCRSRRLRRGAPDDVQRVRCS